jgi:hypothetical protein
MALGIGTARHAKAKMNKLTYRVEADFLPFRHWLIMAEGEADARHQIATQLRIPYGQTSARLVLVDNL